MDLDTRWPPVIKRTGENGPWAFLALGLFWLMSYYILYLVRLVCVFFCLLLPAWLSKLEDGICSAWMSPGVPSAERFLLISRQRAKHQHMSSHHTSPFFFPPPSTHPSTNAETKMSFSCLNALMYFSSAPLPPPVSTSICHRLCEGTPSSPTSILHSPWS